MKQALAYYTTYPIVWFITLLPFRVLYIISDVLYYLLTISKYRKKVIIKNLTNSFPEKSHEEIHELFKQYNRYLCDLILETLKGRTITKKEINKRVVFKNKEVIHDVMKTGKSVILVMGHYGNWEIAGSAFCLNFDYQLNVIYRPLANEYYERLFTKIRTKFGLRITPVSQTLRDLVANRKKQEVHAFIADQTAFGDIAYWATFLNQDTPVFTGPEKLSIKFDYPVVYISVNRVKRGYYEITPELLFDKPRETQENEISEAFIRTLERDILKNPPIWLWSHKRWKYSKQQYNLHNTN